MSEKRRRIAVVLPRHRLWIWQRQAIVRIKRCFDVDEYFTGTAQPYSRSIERWLRFESLLLGEPPLAHRVNIESEQPWPPAAAIDYAFILNLSESPIPTSNTIVAEVRYNGLADSTSLLASLFMRQSPHLSVHFSNMAQPIVTSFVNVSDKIVLGRGLQASFSRLILLVERAANHIAGRTTATDISALHRAPPQYSSRALARFGARFFIDKFYFRFVRKLQVTEYWSIALFRCLHFDVACDFRGTSLIPVQDDGRRFYADPFLIIEQGNTWLFFEDLEYRSGKGTISCVQVFETGQVSQPRSVLERPYHLSYPFIFRHEKNIYMLPESGSSKNVELYRAQSFPYDWTLECILMRDIELYDATLLRHENRWWLFGTTSSDGNMPFDELALFYSDALEGPWHPHAGNPVKSDCRSARPAGRIIAQGNRLFRPAQDCEASYGSAIVWFEILKLTPDAFYEKAVGRWDGNLINAQGLHTFDHAGGWGVIDLKRTTWKRI